MKMYKRSLIVYVDEADTKANFLETSALVNDWPKEVAVEGQSNSKIISWGECSARCKKNTSSI